mmetsp:Transcript_112471/g.220457  ORF Transcript_112471/g.220457 Transcript_112471/m.220457 type:complete len:80 (+) Transcript_112471:89-328(+)
MAVHMVCKETKVHESIDVVRESRKRAQHWTYTQGAIHSANPLNGVCLRDLGNKHPRKMRGVWTKSAEFPSKLPSQARCA